MLNALPSRDSLPVTVGSLRIPLVLVEIFGALIAGPD